MTPSIDLSHSQLNIIRTIINQNIPPNTKVWVFGSRAKGNARTYSDLDIALEDQAGNTLPFDIILKLNADFEASSLPWTVDIIDLNSVNESFRDIINQQKIPLDH